ncbi:hypothetical protein ACWECC_01325 [Streptomyces microflavus]
MATRISNARRSTGFPCRRWAGSSARGRVLNVFRTPGALPPLRAEGLLTCCFSARLRDSLSNPGAPLLRLFKVLGDAGAAAFPQVKPVSANPSVATDIRECRMLPPHEVTELVEAYRHGAEMNELARRYGVHRHTVDRHLERAGVAKRPVAKVTPARVEQAKELYAQGLSTNQIGKHSASVEARSGRRSSERE